MLYDKRKRSSSLERWPTTMRNFQTSTLLWSDWVRSPFLDYLNLIDYEYKKKSLDTIPWFHAYFTQSEILKYCLRSIYSVYKPIMMNNITQCDPQNLKALVEKILYVYRLFNTPYDFDESSYLYYHIAYNMLDKDCEDPALLLALWRTLCVSNKSKMTVFTGIIGRHRKHKAVKLLHYIMKAAYSVRFDFWGAWSNSQELNSLHYCPVTAALLTGSLEQMIILLQYGFEPSYQRIFTYENHFMTRVDVVYDWLKIPLAEKILTRKSIVTEVLIFLMNVARCRSHTKRTAMAKCFCLLWSVLPAPLVTSQELKNEVHQRFSHPPFFNSIMYPSTENQFLELCDYYALLFPRESIEVSQPRSLMHLSKCVSRKQLQKAWSLPFGIKKLHLPKILKSYLLVDANQ